MTRADARSRFASLSASAAAGKRTYTNAALHVHWRMPVSFFGALFLFESSEPKHARFLGDTEAGFRLVHRSESGRTIRHALTEGFYFAGG